jgi:hypothetical protein
MSDVLWRAVQRSRGALPVIEPLIAPRYAVARSILDPVGRATGGRAVEADLAGGRATDAGPDRRTWPAGAGGRHPGTDLGAAGRPRAAGSGSPDGHSGASGLAWTDPRSEVSGTSAYHYRAPAGPGALGPLGLQPDLPAPRSPEGPPPGPAGQGEPHKPARTAGSGEPVLPGTEIPASWARPGEYSGAPRPGQRSWLASGSADGNDGEPGVPPPAGARSAHRAALLGRDESARLTAQPGAALVSPALTITIGHIEVRAVPEVRSRPQPATPDPPRRQPFRPQVTLAEFLGRTEPGQAQGHRR